MDIVDGDVAVELSAALSRFPHRTLGVLALDGFHPLDLWGPLEMFAGLSPAVSMLLVGSSEGPIRGAHGSRVMADVTMAESSRLDLMLLPGGVPVEQTTDTEITEWLAWHAPDAEIVMAVGEGTVLLARAGLLDGRRAAVVGGDSPLLARAHPEVKWVAEGRWVEDGRFVTARGGLAAIDMSLAVIRRLFGEAIATKAAARGGYRWTPASKPSPPHRADRSG